MAIRYGFFNAVKQSDGTYDRTYSANDINECFNTLVTKGVCKNFEDELCVQADEGMQIKVGAGRAIIGGKWFENTTTHYLTINPAHATLNRYTGIVIQLDNSARTITITTKDGEPAENPRGVVIEGSELCLATIYVPKGATSISQSNIKDLRDDVVFCGWVTTRAVSAAHTRIETYEWVINTDSQKNQIFELERLYNYDSTDIFFVNINGIALMRNEDYFVESSDDPVSIRMRTPLSAGNRLGIVIIKTRNFIKST